MSDAHLPLINIERLDGLAARAKEPKVIDLGEKRRKVEDLAWREKLITSKTGAPKALLANVITALRYAPEWDGVLAYDEFACSTRLLLPPPWEKDVKNWKRRKWEPGDDVLLTNWLHHAGIAVRVPDAHTGVDTVAAKDHGYHPIRDYLCGLKWDGKSRVGTWQTVYLGAEDTPLNSEFGRCFLISAIARVFKPGCKVDHLPVWEGGQGIGKSTAAKILAGEWFSDDMPDMGTKDAALSVRAAWIHELSELDAMYRSHVGKVKAFVSRRVDKFRPPYGARLIEQPRQSVFLGTTNCDTYLKDATGNRRFWPVKVTAIDQNALTRDRDQLWAEAVVLYRRDVPWHLTDAEIIRAAEVAQAERSEEDIWTEPVADYVEPFQYVSVAEILQQRLGIELQKQDQRPQNRVAAILNNIGWEKCRKRVAGKPEWRYRRKPAE